MGIKTLMSDFHPKLNSNKAPASTVAGWHASVALGTKPDI